jgi:hypothetical protein
LIRKQTKSDFILADNLRIRPEKHAFMPGDTLNPRHHGQHYHIEHRINPQKPWSKKNIEKEKPPGYQEGSGTGFLPGEKFPGAN